MQFINIVVHSVEDMNFRVHLQYEFSMLGLDEYLEKLRHTESEELQVRHGTRIGAERGREQQGRGYTALGIIYGVGVGGKCMRAGKMFATNPYYSGNKINMFRRENFTIW